MRLFRYIVGLILSAHLLQPGDAQEVLWSGPGVGERPNVIFLGEEKAGRQVLVTSPFGNQVKSYNLNGGDLNWSRTFPERMPFPNLPLTEAVVLQGDQGTVWAIRQRDGEILWEAPTSKPLDYPSAPPRFRDGHAFTFSRKGWVHKLNETGQVIAQAQQSTSWGKRQAKPVPLRSNQNELAYLDQSGRYTVYDPATLEQQVHLLWENSEDARRSYGQTREALGGATLNGSDLLWTVEIPGLLRAFSLNETQELWKQKLGVLERLWSEDDEMTALPTPTLHSGQAHILVTTRDTASLFVGQSGEPASTLPLPSNAVAAPAYDSTQKVWWILCERHLVSLSPSVEWRQLNLPIVDRPFTLRVRDNTAVIGTLEGRLYTLSLPPYQ